MKLTKEEREKAVKLLIGYISQNSTSPKDRKTVLDSALNRFPFTEEQRNDSSKDSKINAVHSVMGSVFNDMLSRNEIIKKGNGYVLRQEETVAVDKKICRDRLLSFLSKAPHGEKEICATLIRQFGADKTDSKKDDDLIVSFVGQILGELLKEEKITRDGDNYLMRGAAGQYPKEPLKEELFEKVFLDRICDNGGRFFEFFVANLLEKYFLITGRDVLSCEVSGGSEDGGVDVIIDTIEELGFTEHIMVQAKCRKNIQVTEKEIREFYGAMTAQSGSRGIFITTSFFHPSAEKLLLSISNCVGVDGHRIFELVKQTAYGIRKNREGYLFDESIFRI